MTIPHSAYCKSTGTRSSNGKWQMVSRFTIEMYDRYIHRQFRSPFPACPISFGYTPALSSCLTCNQIILNFGEIRYPFELLLLKFL